jgi:hypothetical protein
MHFGAFADQIPNPVFIMIHLTFLLVALWFAYQCYQSKYTLASLGFFDVFNFTIFVYFISYQCYSDFVFLHFGGGFEFPGICEFVHGDWPGLGGGKSDEAVGERG